jgi:hypothetical protein
MDGRYFAMSQEGGAIIALNFTAETRRRREEHYFLPRRTQKTQIVKKLKIFFLRSSRSLRLNYLFSAPPRLCGESFCIIKAHPA